jgi:hypothetical protein
MWCGCLSHFLCENRKNRKSENQQEEDFEMFEMLSFPYFGQYVLSRFYFSINRGSWVLGVSSVSFYRHMIFFHNYKLVVAGELETPSLLRMLVAHFRLQFTIFWSG